MGLRGKLYIPLLLLSVLLASYIYGIWMPRAHEDAKRGYRSLLEKHLNNVADGLVPLMLGRQIDTVYGTLDNLRKENSDWLDIQLFDADGRSFYPLNAPPVSEDHEDRDVIILKKEIRYLGVVLGKLNVTVDLTPRLKELGKQNMTLVSILLAVALLFLLTNCLILERVVRRPIRRLADAAKGIAAGDYTTNLPKTGADEIGGMVTSFAAMRDAVRLYTGMLIDANEDVRRLNAELEQKIVQLQETQEDLVRKEKLAILGQLSGSVGHELRNPLGVMNNAVYFLKMVLAEADETTKEYLDIIKHEIDNSQRIITDLLDFARTRPPQMKAITTRELTEQSLCRCAIPENIELQTKIPDNLPLLRVDPLQIGQVLTNLVTNAVQAMPGGGALRIRARSVGAGLAPAQAAPAQTGYPQGAPLQDFIAISVNDTGEGISHENMKKLFQPLFTTKARGIGLGLVVCKNLVETNGGRIEVESEPGKGTTFTVLLPIERNKI